MTKNWGILFFQTEFSDPIAKAKYSEMSAKIERISQFYYFFLVKFSIPCTLFPSLVITIINYYVYDLGDEAFFLPSPIVYVFWINWLFKKKFPVKFCWFYPAECHSIGKHRLDISLHCYLNVWQYIVYSWAQFRVSLF